MPGIFIFKKIQEQGKSMDGYFDLHHNKKTAHPVRGMRLEYTNNMYA